MLEKVISTVPIPILWKTSDVEDKRARSMRRFYIGVGVSLLFHALLMIFVPRPLQTGNPPDQSAAKGAIGGATHTARGGAAHGDRIAHRTCAAASRPTANGTAHDGSAENAAAKSDNSSCSPRAAAQSANAARTTRAEHDGDGGRGARAAARNGRRRATIQCGLTQK